jgi:hypothetical protein
MWQAHPQYFNSLENLIPVQISMPLCYPLYIIIPMVAFSIMASVYLLFLFPQVQSHLISLAVCLKTQN